MMNILIEIGKELWGLFVDDKSHSLAILFWVGLVAAIAHYLNRPIWTGPAFAAGLAVIIVENVVRSAARFRKKSTS